MKHVTIWAALIAVVVISLGYTGFVMSKDSETMSNRKHAEATFAGGCFWCMEPPFHNQDGVLDVFAGYSGGHVDNPTYEQVCSGTTGHLEVVKVEYDPSVVRYEHLLELFWQNIDPTDEYGQFADRGTQYETAIFYHNDEQKRLAEKSKADLQNSGMFDRPIVTKILPFTSFFPAEQYHQDYYEKNPTHYKRYKKGSGRESFIEQTWQSENAYKFNREQKMSEADLQTKLTPMQYQVTQQCGTEPPFQNEYWDNHAEGIYVDVVSGEPLFASVDKYDSGTGWPSFSKPIEEDALTTKKDYKLLVPRTEVRSSGADSHLGHVFDDSNSDTGLRYCINSASLRFIPRGKLAEEGYAEYESLFSK